MIIVKLYLKVINVYKLNKDIILCIRFSDKLYNLVFYILLLVYMYLMWLFFFSFEEIWLCRYNFKWNWIINLFVFWNKVF